MSQKSPKKVSSYEYIKVSEPDLKGEHTIVKYGPPSAYELKRDACRAYPGLDNYYNFYPRFEGFKK